MTPARDGAAALRAYRAAKPSLILLDIMIPETSGLDVCREIRRQDPLTPILMLTAKDTEVGRADKDNPIAWIQQVGQGRVFYCSLGHGGHSFREKTRLQFYLDGIQYALGDLKADATPSAKLSPQPTPVLAPEAPK